MEFLSLDHRGFVADYLFVQVSLHSGGLMWKPLDIQFDSQWSFGTVDLLTDLDPQYYTAYLFSGMGLIHNFDDAKLAKPILQKGMAVFPDSWELPFWIGYDHYTYLEDYQTAAQYFYEAAQKPGAPGRFLALLVSAAKKGGSYENAFWAMKIMMESAEDEKTRQVYEKKLVQLENLIVLTQASQKFNEITGHYPESLTDLTRKGLVPGLPEDPLGMAYTWDSEKKRVVMGKN